MTGQRKEYTTRTVKVWLRDDGIAHVVVLPGAEITLEDAKANTKPIRAFTL